MTPTTDSPARDRNARGQGDRLRRELLEAATALMSTPHHASPPSLRAVARAAGVAPSAVYLHFDSGEQLAEAVVEDVFADLVRAVEAVDGPVAASGADPTTRLHAVAAALARWAERRPGAYQLLFEAPDLAGAADGAHGPDGPGMVLLDLVRDLVEGSGASRAAAAAVVPRIWASLHGVISLRLHKPQGPWVEDLATDVDAVLTALLASVGARPA